MSDRHTISPYPIRMPQDLRDLLEASAREGSRSLHAEIISRLWSTFEKTEPVSEPRDMSFTVSKERLLATAGDTVTEKENFLLAAMLDAFRRIEDPAAWEAAQPSKGPKPRKPYQKK